MSEVSREELESLRAEVAALRARLDALEGGGGLDEELLFVISSAVAAFLGKRATVKFVRRSPRGSDQWRTEGRVEVAGSHRMPRTRGW